MTQLKESREAAARGAAPAGSPALACQCPALVAAGSTALVWKRRVGSATHHGLAERCDSPPFSDSSNCGTTAWRVLSLQDDEPIHYPARLASSVRNNPQPHPNGWPLTCIPPAQNEPPWNPRAPLPSGLRAGTPDRRGKRGEVAAIFAIITTEPTWSIGELGLWITSRTSAPSKAHARPSWPNSSSPGCPRGTSRMPPTFSSGTPNSATTGRGPSALAVATSNCCLPDLRPRSSRRVWITRTFAMWRLAAVAATQSSRRRWESTSVNDVASNTAARGRPGSPAPDPRSTHCSPTCGVRTVARPSASSMCRSRRRAPSWGPRNPRSTASRYACSSLLSLASDLASSIAATLGLLWDWSLQGSECIGTAEALRRSADPPIRRSADPILQIEVSSLAANEGRNRQRGCTVTPQSPRRLTPDIRPGRHA